MSSGGTPLDRTGCPSTVESASRPSTEPATRSGVGPRDTRFVTARRLQTGFKWCPDCAAYQPVDSFALNRASRDGRGSYCKTHTNERNRASHFVRTYGLTVNKVVVMTERQAGVCAICLRSLEGKPHVDHDHGSGEVRGLLCFNCNQGLGQFRDDVWSLRRAAEYLTGGMIAPIKIAPGVYDVGSPYRRPGS
jgi:hypothetical protein